MKARVLVFATGLLFSLGLGISGMTHPGRVLAFLDVGGQWDPTLAFVMGGAVGVHALLRSRILRRSAPYLDSRFHLPTQRAIDLRLVAGAVLFGAGWGLSGFCPGPAIVSLVRATPETLLFVAAMVGGMAAAQRVRSSDEQLVAGTTLNPPPSAAPPCG